MEITNKNIEDTLRDIFKGDDMFVKELTKEEIAYKRHILGNFAIDSLGERIFKLPGGQLTGIGGLELFNQAVRKAFNNYGK